MLSFVSANLKSQALGFVPPLVMINDHYIVMMMYETLLQKFPCPSLSFLQYSTGAYVMPFLSAHKENKHTFILFLGAERTTELNRRHHTAANVNCFFLSA
jgi:hypothetical protein